MRGVTGHIASIPHELAADAREGCDWQSGTVIAEATLGSTALRSADAACGGPVRYDSTFANDQDAERGAAR